MRTILIMTIGFLFFGVSCKDDSYHTIIKGKVINYGNKQPVDSVLVVIRDGIASGGGWFELGGGNTSSDKKSFTYTDVNGNFKVELKGEHSAYVGFSKKRYNYKNHVGGTYIGYKYYSDGKFENQVFEMEAESGFAPFLISKYRTYNDDTLFFETLVLWGKNEKNEKYFPLNSEKFIGTGPFRYGYLDSPYTVIGYTYQPFRITLKRQSTKIVIIDSVYLKSFETFSDTIYY